MRLHDIRHAVAQALAEDPDVPLVAVSGQLGHSSATFTASVYQQKTDKLSRRTANAIERAFGAGS